MSTSLLLWIVISDCNGGLIPGRFELIEDEPVDETDECARGMFGMFDGL